MQVKIRQSYMHACVCSMDGLLVIKASHLISNAYVIWLSRAVIELDVRDTTYTIILYIHISSSINQHSSCFSIAIPSSEHKGSTTLCYKIHNIASFWSNSWHNVISEVNIIQHTSLSLKLTFSPGIDIRTLTLAASPFLALSMRSVVNWGIPHASNTDILAWTVYYCSQLAYLVLLNACWIQAWLIQCNRLNLVVHIERDTNFCQQCFHFCGKNWGDDPNCNTRSLQ